MTYHCKTRKILMLSFTRDQGLRKANQPHITQTKHLCCTPNWDLSLSNIWIIIKMQNNNVFITVDDDPINQFLSKVIITKNVNNAEVISFGNVLDAIGYITKEGAQFSKINLLLDINMPQFDGWDFLDQFDKFDIDFKQKFDIYLLSSSTDKADFNKAKFYPSVIDFVAKPLTSNSLDTIFKRLKAA